MFEHWPNMNSLTNNVTVLIALRTILLNYHNMNITKRKSGKSFTT